MKLEELSKEQLIEEINKLKKRKKFGLVWENKPENVVEKCQKELPFLEEVYEREIINDLDKAFNLLIEGDNYHALSVLNYTHAAQIDVIYIDPPYNTGSNSWIYNNRIIDSNDTFRHSKWLSFMEKRLRLSRSLLKEDGVIVVTIDDYELYTLGLLLDEIFGESNKIGVITIENNPRGRTANRFYATSHEYYLIYAKDASLAKITNLPLTEEQKNTYKFEDEKSNYKLRPLRKSGADSRRADRPKQYYPIYIDPNSLKGSLDKRDGWDIVYPIDNTNTERVWIIGTEKCKEFLENGEIIIKKKDRRYSIFVKDRIKAGRKPRTVWVSPKYDTSSHGASLLLKMFGRKVFDYPKSLYAVKDYLFTAIGNKSDAVILDFFAGSGTTGHAVLELNKEDGGNRKFILCTNNENEIAEEVCYPRIRKVIEGYSNVKGIPANLKYFKTTFVAKSLVSDDTRIEIVKKSTEMICVKEGTFEEIFVNDEYKIFKDANHSTAILFNLDCLKELKEKILSLKLPSSIYVFSLSNDTYDKDFEDLSVEHELCPIPESILEVYRKLFKD